MAMIVVSDGDNSDDDDGGDNADNDNGGDNGDDGDYDCDDNNGNE